MDKKAITLAAKRAIKALEADGRIGSETSERTYTFDGIVGDRPNANGLVFISSDLPDINSIKSVGAIFNGQRMTIEKNGLTIQDKTTDMDGIFAVAYYGEYPAVYINFTEIGVPPGLYVLCGDENNYVASVTFESGEVKPIDGKYLPKGGVGYSEGGYKETVVAEQEVIAVYDSVSGETTIEVPANAHISVGDELTVIWDGTKYVCVAFEESGVVGFGNKGAVGLGEDTDEPFILVYNSQENAIAGNVVSADNETHTIAIYKGGEIVHVIDPKYLAKRINLADYGIDLATIVMSGVKKTVIEGTGEAFYNAINCGENLVCVGVFDTSTLEAIPSLYSSDAEWGRTALSFALTTVYGGFIIKADVVIQCGFDNGVLTENIYVYCDTTTTALE